MQHELVYEQGSGRLLLQDRDGCLALLAIGYSGAPGYVNNPNAERRLAEGPIPVGMWAVGASVDHPRLGSVSLPLAPVDYRFEAGAQRETIATSRHGRSAFYIHGDNAKMNQSASRGCIIMPKGVRLAIAALSIKRLRVIM